MHPHRKERWWSEWIGTLSVVAFIALMALIVNAKALWGLAARWIAGL
ncbi:MAG TPA: hypothetical protein VKY65_19935 [Alphaproteobacteria bacterium]|nr:hypothetical protein [Alphaproteobacteria bacterium]